MNDPDVSNRKFRHIIKLAQLPSLVQSIVSKIKTDHGQLPSAPPVPMTIPSPVAAQVPVTLTSMQVQTGTSNVPQLTTPADA